MRDVNSFQFIGINIGSRLVHYPPSSSKTQYFDLSKALGHKTFDGNEKALEASLDMGSKILQVIAT